MTEKDTVMVLAMLSAFYGEGKSDVRLMAAAWHALLKDYNVAVAQRAVLRFAKNDQREYASFPTAGKIIAAIEEEMGIRRGIFNSIKNRQNYDTLDERYKELIPKDRYENALTKTDAELEEGKDAFIQSLMPTEVLQIGTEKR